MVNQLFGELANLEQVEAIALGGSRAGEFYDENGPHTADRTVDAEVFEQAKSYLEGGRIVRKTVEDPEMIMLDGSESGYQLWWNGMSELERSRYEFLPAEPQEWHFKEFNDNVITERILDAIKNNYADALVAIKSIPLQKKLESIKKDFN